MEEYSLNAPHMRLRISFIIAENIFRQYIILINKESHNYRTIIANWQQFLLIISNLE